MNLGVSLANPAASFALNLAVATSAGLATSLTKGPGNEQLGYEQSGYDPGHKSGNEQGHKPPTSLAVSLVASLPSGLAADPDPKAPPNFLKERSYERLY